MQRDLKGSDSSESTPGCSMVTVAVVVPATSHARMRSQSNIPRIGTFCIFPKSTVARDSRSNQDFLRHAEAWAPVVSKLNLLLDVLGCLETEQADLRTHQLVQDAVNACASTSTGKQAKSLESQLKPLMCNFSETVRKVIAQIDKIARYSSLCNDIVKMMTRPRLRKLFQHLQLEPLYSPKASRPPGSPERCYIHAEVQLIFYYEENPKLLPPRVLGCSKSACS